MVVGDLLFKRGEVESADARRRPREAFLDHVLREADAFEHLRATVAAERRDAHLRHDLQESLVDGLDVV